MSVSRGVYRSEEECVQGCGRNHTGKRRFECLAVNGSIILKCTLNASTWCEMDSSSW